MKLILLFLVLLGCTTVDLDAMTEAERAAYIQGKEQEEYDRIERRDIEYDKIRALKEQCSALGYVLVYQGWSGARHRHDPDYISPRDRLSDYGCMSQQDLRRALGRGY